MGGGQTKITMPEPLPSTPLQRVLRSHTKTPKRSPDHLYLNSKPENAVPRTEPLPTSVTSLQLPMIAINGSIPLFFGTTFNVTDTQTYWEDMDGTQPLYCTEETALAAFYAESSKTFTERRNAYVHQIKPTGETNAFVDIGKWQSMVQFYRWFAENNRAKKKREEVKTLILGMYGCDVDEPDEYNFVAHHQAWNKLAIEFETDEEFKSRVEANLEKHRSKFEIVLPALYQSGCCIRASLFEPDQKLHNLMLKWVRSINASGMASRPLPAWAHPPLDVKYIGSEHLFFHAEYILPMSNRAVMVEKSYLVENPEEEEKSAPKFVDACF